jgi:hypothetical protein
MIFLMLLIKMKKTIAGYENYEITPEGEVFNINGRKLTPYISKCCGRMRVGLMSNKRPAALEIHRLLGIAFIPNPENKKFVDHIDGDKLNNSLNNLRWLTASENTFNAPKKSNKITGINIVDNRWQACINKDNKPRRAYFALTEEGKMEAIEWRKKMELELYGFNPENKQIKEYKKNELVASGVVGIRHLKQRDHNYWRATVFIDTKRIQKQFPFTPEGLKNAAEWRVDMVI